MSAAAPDLAPAGAEEESVAGVEEECSSPCYLLAVPDDVNALLLSLLPLMDIARLACTCTALAGTSTAALRRVRVLSVEALGCSTASCAALAWATKHCTLLESVELDSATTDEHLAAMLACHEGGELPLQRCTRVRFPDSLVKDAGAQALLDALPLLTLLDATGCADVTHDSVLHAATVPATAARLVSPLVQRLPTWFAQSWVCQAHRNIAVGEVHQYRADGTFAFTRQHQAVGWVHSFRTAPAHFELTVIYSDDADLVVFGLNNWRPCVCIKPSANGLQMRTAQRTGLADSTCPTHVPEQDEPGICTGSWRVGTTTT